MLWQKKEKEKSSEQMLTVIHLRRKGIVLAATFALLIVLIVVGTVAWYTRIANVTGMTLNVADFDVKANFNEEEFVIDVNDYLNVQKDKAAPGTGGVVPVLVQSKSQTDVEYSISLNMLNMAPEFLQRIRFYYYTGSASNPKKTYLGGERYLYTQQEDGTWKCSAPTKDASPNEIKGKLTAEKNECYEFIYWEWIYSLDDPTVKNSMYNLESGTWGSGTPEEEQITAHNDFDTKLGLGKCDDTFTSDIDPKRFAKTKDTEDEDAPLAYQRAMMVTLSVVGAQAKPREGKAADYANATSGNGTTIYVANG